MTLIPIQSPIKALAADMLGLNVVWADDKSCQTILSAAGLDSETEQEAAWVLTTLAIAKIKPAELQT